MATGSYTYTVPWDQVDPDVSSQVVSLTDFTLTFGGQTFSASTTSFSTLPTGNLTYGELQSVNFALTFPIPVNGYSGLSVTGGIAIAVDATSGQAEAADVVAAGPTSVTLDFGTVTIPPATGQAYEVRIRWATVQPGSPEPPPSAFNVMPGQTTADLTASAQRALQGAGLTVTPVMGSTTKLTVTAPIGVDLKWLIFHTNETGTTGPKVVAQEKGNVPDFAEFLWKIN